jgi:hypothetical protein
MFTLRRQSEHRDSSCWRRQAVARRLGPMSLNMGATFRGAMSEPLTPHPLCIGSGSAPVAAIEQADAHSIPYAASGQCRKPMLTLGAGAADCALPGTGNGTASWATPIFCAPVLLAAEKTPASAAARRGTARSSRCTAGAAPKDVAAAGRLPKRAVAARYPPSKLPRSGCSAMKVETSITSGRGIQPVVSK